MTRKTFTVGLLIAICAITADTAYAQDHFAPAIANIRDWTVPDPGLYGALYNYGLLTNSLNGPDGNALNSVTVTGPNGRTATINVGVNLNAYALAPMFVWVPPMRKIFGARYGAFVTPSFTNASLNGLVSAGIGAGLSASTGQFNAGDIFVQPVWLDWGGTHYDISYGYGFYIPSGSYKIETVTVPVVGDVRVASPNNTGLGFWENQNQGAFYFYPWADKRMAIENLLTWEINQQKRAIDLTPGQHLTWNWGLSQYLPLKKDQSILAEVGPAGYLSYQVTDNSGTAARNPGVHDHVNAAGIQLGVTWPKQMIVLNFHFFHEYSAVDQFQGNEYGLNLIVRLKGFKK
jgi:hypothetical protein